MFTGPAVEIMTYIASVQNPAVAQALLYQSTTLPVLTESNTDGTFKPAAPFYKFVNRNERQVVGCKWRFKLLDGAQMIQWPDNGGYNQQWQLVDLGNGYYKVINRNSGKLLDVNGGSTQGAAKVIQWPDNGGI